MRTRLIQAPDWKTLIFWPDPDQLSRSNSPNWQWHMNDNSVVLLRPALKDHKSTRVAVAAQTLKGTPWHPSLTPAELWNQTVTTIMRLHWFWPTELSLGGLQQ